MDRETIIHCSVGHRRDDGRESGRGERIRTSDHLHPMQVRYQAALRPELSIMPEKIHRDSNVMMDCSSFLNASGTF